VKEVHKEAVLRRDHWARLSVAVIAVFSLFLLLFLLSSCAAPTTGTITGYALKSGGPFNFEENKAKTWPTEGTEVTASPVGGDGSKAWTTDDVKDDGSFSIEGPPGTYDVNACFDSCRGGHVGPKRVTVKVGGTVEVNVSLMFP
jgi:hypothetical protein